MHRESEIRLLSRVTKGRIMIQLFKEYYSEMIVPYWNDVKEYYSEMIVPYWADVKECFKEFVVGFKS